MWPGVGWGCAATMDRPDYGLGRDSRYMQDNLNIILNDRLEVTVAMDADAY